jgi:hypothetical protein
MEERVEVENFGRWTTGGSVMKVGGNSMTRKYTTTATNGLRCPLLMIGGRGSSRRKF